MTPLVVDASAAAAFVVDSQSTSASRALLERWGEFIPIAPYVYALETPWLLLKLERKSRERGFARAALATLADLGTEIMAAPDPPELDAAFQLAVDENMGFYDAMYVMLAKATAAPVASRDKWLIDVCRALAIEVLDLR